MQNFKTSNIWAQLICHLFFTNQQHRFCQRMLCETRLIQIMDDWAKELNIGSRQNDIELLEFSKAFDPKLDQRLFARHKASGLHKWFIIPASTSLILCSPIVRRGAWTTALHKWHYLRYIQSTESGLLMTVHFMMEYHCFKTHCNYKRTWLPSRSGNTDGS